MSYTIQVSNAILILVVKYNNEMNEWKPAWTSKSEFQYVHTVSAHQRIWLKEREKRLIF